MNAAKYIIGTLSLATIIYKAYDIFNLLAYQRELIAHGITDTSQINSEIVGSYWVIFFAVGIIFVLFLVFKNE